MHAGWQYGGWNLHYGDVEIASFKGFLETCSSELSELKWCHISFDKAFQAAPNDMLISVFVIVKSLTARKKPFPISMSRPKQFFIYYYATSSIAICERLYDKKIYVFISMCASRCGASNDAYHSSCWKTSLAHVFEKPWFQCIFSIYVM